MRKKILLLLTALLPLITCIVADAQTTFEAPILTEMEINGNVLHRDVVNATFQVISEEAKTCALIKVPDIGSATIVYIPVAAKGYCVDVIEKGAFANCYLEKIVLFTNTESDLYIASGAFSSCYLLKSIVVYGRGRDFPRLEETGFDQNIYSQATLEIYRVQEEKEGEKTAICSQLPGWRKFTNVKEFATEGDCVSFTASSDEGILLNFIMQGYSDECKLGRWSDTPTANSDDKYDRLTPAYYEWDTSAQGTTLTIPGKVGAFKVVEAVRYALCKCEKLEHLVISEGIESFQGGALRDCTNLRSLHIPASLTSNSLEGLTIGLNALETITVAEGNSRYDSRNNCNAIIEKDFYNRYRYEEIHDVKLVAGCKTTIIPDGVTMIGCAFQDLDITTINLPESVNYIHIDAFRRCTQLKSIHIPDGVTTIWQRAFDGCTSLTDINIPASLSKLGPQAFNGCTSLTSIQLPNDLQLKEGSEFYGCTSLKSINIPSNTTSIPLSFLRGCNSLESIEIPAGVTSIGHFAFFRCSSLKSITSHIKEPFDIEEDVFQVWNSETKKDEFTRATLYVPFGTKAKYQAAEGWKLFENIVEMAPATLQVGDLFTEQTKEGVTMTFRVTSLDPMECEVGDGTAACISTNTSGEVTIPDKPRGFMTRKIADYGFAKCSQMKRCWVNDSIWYIGAHAFDGCTAMTTIDLPKVIKDISPVFVDHSVTVNTPATASEAVKRIIGEACEKTGSTVTASRITPQEAKEMKDRVYIWAQVRDIEDHFIAYCESVATIEVSEENPLFDSRENCNAIIRTADNTLLFGCKNTNIPETVVAIAPYAFEGHRGLERLMLPASLQSIGESAFVDCSGITSVTSDIEQPFAIADNTFSDVTYSTATLIVPNGKKAQYQATNGWKNFFNIKEMEKKKVEKPEISVVNGQLLFSCATEDVEYNWSITTDNANSGKGNNVPFSQSITVSVIATKPGYENSETATKHFSASSLTGDLNGDGKVNVADHVKLTEIIMGQ